MLRILQLSLLATICLTWSGRAVAEERSDGCRAFHGEYELDRGASDVYIAGRDADGKGTCFLVPRAVTALISRKYYMDAGPIDTVGFEPADLRIYLKDQSEISVGERRRKVPKALDECLSSPPPLTLAVLSGEPWKPNQIERFEGRASELPSDMPGYRRFQEDGWPADYYIASDPAKGVKSFACGPYQDTKACALNGEHNRIWLRIGYRKSDMGQVVPEHALQCASLVADMFRIK